MKGIFQAIELDTEMLHTLVDGSSNAIYIRDFNTYELLYANEKALHLDRVEEPYQGIKCHRAFRHSDTPCESCPQKQLTYDKYYNEEFDSSTTGRHYMAKGRLLKWMGRTVHVEYMIDETDLYQTKVNLRNLTDNLPSGIGIYNVYSDGAVELVYLNDGYYAMLGVERHEREDYMGFSVVNAIYQEDIPKLQREIKEAIREHRIINIDLRVLDGQQEYRWLNIRGKIVSETDEMCTINASYTDVDVAKRQQQEHMLRYQAELQLRHKLFENSILYYQMNITQYTIEEYQIPGNSEIKAPKTPFSMKGQKSKILSQVEEEYQQLVEDTLFPQALLEKYRKGIYTDSCEYRRKVAGKGYCWVRGSVTVISKPETSDIIAFVNIIDIDTEKKYQMAVHDILNQDMESVIILNLNRKAVFIAMENRQWDNHHQGEVFVLDDSFRSALLEDILEEDRKDSETFISVPNLLRKLKEEGVARHNYRIHGADGKIQRKKVKVLFLNEKQEDIVYTRRDITDLYEEEQKQKRRLENAIDEANAANQAKGDFLSGVSHDMRTPLNAIISLSGKEMREGITEEEKEDYLNKIHESGEYLLGIINNVLDMSKIENQKMVLRPQIYHVQEFANAMETIIGETCRQKGITFHINLERSNQEVVMVDKTRFNQIFVNLLSNAAKYTPEGGKIEIQIESLGIRENIAHLKFIVSDNGIGMSSEFVPHAFERFAQEEHQEQTMVGQGTGLGLSIVKQLVELMNGTIELESALGKGTRYTLFMNLPVALEVQPEAQRQSVDKVLKGMKILLCEDHPLNRQIAKKLLEKKQCIVELAENGKIGVEMFRKSPVNYYDAILMDIRMPIMDGLEAAKTIRISRRLDAVDVPIIAMTANAFSEDVQIAKAAGMNEHLSKPIEPKLFYETLAAYGKNSTNDSK